MTAQESCTRVYTSTSILYALLSIKATCNYTPMVVEKPNYYHELMKEDPASCSCYRFPYHYPVFNICGKMSTFFPKEKARDRMATRICIKTAAAFDPIFKDFLRQFILYPSQRLSTFISHNLLPPDLAANVTLIGNAEPMDRSCNLHC